MKTNWKRRKMVKERKKAWGTDSDLLSAFPPYISGGYVVL